MVGVSALGDALDHDSIREPREHALVPESGRSRATLDQAAAPWSVAFSQCEAMFNAVERTAHVGSWAWDLITDEIQWSDELFRILGHDSNTVRPSLEAFFAAVHRDDRDRVRRGAQRAAAGSPSEPLEFRIVRPNGTVREVRLEGQLVLNAEGQKSHLLGVVLDVTESMHAANRLSRSVEELRVAQRVAQIGSYLLELPSLRTTWSVGLFELLEVNAANTSSPELFFERVHPHDVGRARAAFDHMIASHSGVSLELRMLRRDGTPWHAFANSLPQHDSEGRLIAFTGILQDVTSRKLEEERLRQSEKMAALGTLAGGIAHDFNNYLQVLIGEAELLRGTLDPAHRGLRALDAIRQAADRCAKLTNQLLTLGRKRAQHLERFALSELVARITPMLRSVLGERNELVVRGERSELFVRADRNEVEHALINLALNARDALVGGGTYTLTWERVLVDAPGSGTGKRSLVRILASDTGVGIEPELLARIFEPFFTTKGVGKGTGLGLATVYSIVEQAEGQIEVESEVGRGTTFRIYLPLDDAPQIAARYQLAEEPASRAGGRTVLVVEDVSALRAVIRAQLLEAGYRVQTAENGQAALDLLATQHQTIEAVLSDVVMPVLGGFELLRRIEELYPHIRCALMSGYADPESVGAAGRIALRKPFSGKELLAAIQGLLKESSTQASSRGLGVANASRF